MIRTRQEVAPVFDRSCQRCLMFPFYPKAASPLCKNAHNCRRRALSAVPERYNGLVTCPRCDPEKTTIPKQGQFCIEMPSASFRPRDHRFISTAVYISSVVFQESWWSKYCEMWFSALMKHSLMHADVIPIGSKLLQVRAVADVHGFRRDFSSFSCNIKPSEWRCVHVNEELFDGRISPVQIKKHSSSNESLEAAPEFQTHSFCVPGPQSHSDIPTPVFIHFLPISSFSSSSLSASVFPGPQIIDWCYLWQISSSRGS